MLAEPVQACSDGLSLAAAQQQFMEARVYPMCGQVCGLHLFDKFVNGWYAYDLQ